MRKEEVLTFIEKELEGENQKWFQLDRDLFDGYGRFYNSFPNLFSVELMVVVEETECSIFGTTLYDQVVREEYETVKAQMKQINETLTYGELDLIREGEDATGICYIYKIPYLERESFDAEAFRGAIENFEYAFQTYGERKTK